ncbi:MAG TPA: ABC transporter permease [Terriglobales bacterium]|nr:ABC transporter permease [Terriglobales bacterium]
MNPFRFFLPKRRLNREFDRELGFHFEELVEANLAKGMAPEEARRQASVDFGGREQMTERLRETHTIPVIETAMANLRFAFRLMRKNPAFSAAIIFTLALGIGANSAVFSAIDAVLLRPLPFPHGDELMRLIQYKPKEKTLPMAVAPPRVEDWNRMNSTFQAISGYYTEDVSYQSGTLPEKVTRAWVAPRFLQVWGVAPQLGRDFTPEEEHVGGPSAVLISDRFWRTRLRNDSSVLGKSIKLDGASFVVIGVMPASFLFPDRDVDLWSPVAPDAPYANSREATWYTAIGRLKPGIKIEQAEADLATVQSRLGMQFPKTDAQLAVTVQPLKNEIVGDSGQSLWILFGSVTLLLLIACMNIAAMLLARNREREQEISIRFSLGASRRTIVGQLLTEILVLAVLGSIAGLTLAWAATKAFQTFTPNLPRVDEIALDWRIVIYSLGCALLVAFLCGIFPALRGTRGEIAGSLQRNSRTQVSSRSNGQWALVGVQVALAVTLLIGAGLLLRTMQELARVSPGFDPSHVLVFHISANWAETANMKGLTQRVNRDLDAVRELPGVEAAATSTGLPGVPGQWQVGIKVLEGQQDPNQKIVSDSRVVSKGYFDVTRIPMLQGKPCRDSVGVTNVVVNRSFANTYFGQESAIGHHLQMDATSFPLSGQIVGVVGDSREQGLNTEPMPTVYWCMSAPMPDPYFLARTKTSPMVAANTIRQAIHRVEPSRSVFAMSTLEEHLRDSFAEDRLRTILLTLFALTAVSLACLGLYGTLSYFVTTRRREVGLRLALGALPKQVASRFLFKGVSVAAIGCLCGLAIAAAAGRVLSGMLYGISRFDLLSFAGAVALVLCVAAVATLLPATRAARTDPMNVLREE